MYPDAQYNQRYAYQPQPPMSAYPGPSNDSVKSNMVITTTMDTNQSVTTIQTIKVHSMIDTSIR